MFLVSYSVFRPMIDNKTNDYGGYHGRNKNGD